ncbi:VOC family protein [Oleisolibacter albus]|uniref:VOC family protein n=1 Tax=Oleisolibacter albus TaxID=2171757 RepID=UPI000DF2D66B|nr:VOC family protein [Oleisolibacter albus]
MRLFRVILGVTDIDAASTFYAALLGQPGRRISPGQQYFDVGRSILACVDGAAEGGAPVPAAAAPLALAVHDLETFLARARTAGARFDAEPMQDLPEEAGSGERSFHCCDPWGNRLVFVEAGTEFTGA